MPVIRFSSLVIFSLADGINSLVSGGHENYGQEDEVVDIFETEEYKTD